MLFDDASVPDCSQYDGKVFILERQLEASLMVNFCCQITDVMQPEQRML